MADENKEGQQQGQQQPKTYTQEEFDSLQQQMQNLQTQLEALKGNRDEVLTEKKKLQQRLQEIEQEGRAQKAGITAEQLEKLRAEVRQDLEKEYAEFKEKAEQLSTENRALKLDNVVKAAMAKSGVRSERIDSLYKLVADEFDLTDDGKPMLKSRPGTVVDKYIAEELIKVYPEWYQGSGSSGGGASKSTGGAGGTRVVTPGDNDAFIANIEGIAKGEVQVAG